MTKLHKNCQGLGETKKFDRDVAAIQPRLSTEQFEIEYLPHKSQYEADAQDPFKFHINFKDKELMNWIKLGNTQHKCDHNLLPAASGLV